jgi:hypothetical protein
MWEFWGACVSAVVAAAGLFASWKKARETSLRREDVLSWCNEVIVALEGLLLIFVLNDPPLDAAIAKTKLTNIIFDTASLAERGRLFFKNEIIDRHGAEKQSAYRGYRPEILDQIVIAHQIARECATTNGEARLRLHLVAEDALKKFVSLAQKEVGRSRTASADTSRGGDGGHLRMLMRNIDADRLTRLQVQAIPGTLVSTRIE